MLKNIRENMDMYNTFEYIYHVLCADKAAKELMKEIDDKKKNVNLLCIFAAISNSFSIENEKYLGNGKCPQIIIDISVCYLYVSVEICRKKYTNLILLHCATHRNLDKLV